MYIGHVYIGGNMIPSIADILQQKIDEIQSRVPVKVKGASESVPFVQYLDDASGNISDSSGDIASSLDASSLSDIAAYNGLSSYRKALLSLEANKTGSLTDKLKINELIEKYISQSSLKYNVDANLIRAVIKHESNFNPYAISRVGAQGLMQLMPDTADSLGVENPWDIGENIDAGTRYLKYQLEAFGGDPTLALAAYNAGPAAVSKYNGVPPYAETQSYVEKVLSSYRNYSNNK
jgi:soluble lytic murein transglycosylase-like protein